ncbi:MAG: glycosyltransferase, partial [Maribacter sp.]
MTKKNILIISSLDRSLVHFRGDFIEALIKHGFEVFCAAPNFTENVITKLNKLGAKEVEFPLARTGLNPFKDMASINVLRKIIKQNHIDLVFPYTIKPVIYGSIAAKRANVPVASLITGLGFTFSAASKKAQFLQRITEALYKFSIRKNRIIIFQNSDDLELFY